MPGKELILKMCVGLLSLSLSLSFCLCVFVRLSVNVCVCLFACLCVYSACVCISVCVCMYMCVCACVCVCVFRSASVPQSTYEGTAFSPWESLSSCYLLLHVPACVQELLWAFCLYLPLILPLECLDYRQVFLLSALWFVESELRSFLCITNPLPTKWLPQAKEVHFCLNRDTLQSCNRFWKCTPNST